MTATNPINKLYLMTVTWNGITFKCTAKNLPVFKDAPTWSVITDDAEEVTGKTYVGKPEGLDPIELTIESDISLIYGSLQAAYIAGTQSTATFTYTNGQSTSSVSVPKCTLCGLSPQGGENNSASTTTIKLQPEGGEEGDMPSAT